MILNAHRVGFWDSDSFDSIVIQIDLVDDRSCPLKALRINGISVILARNRYCPVIEILHRVVRASVAKFELKSLASDCLTQDLITQTDAKDR